MPLGWCNKNVVKKIWISFCQKVRSQAVRIAGAHYGFSSTGYRYRPPSRLLNPRRCPCMCVCIDSIYDIWYMIYSRVGCGFPSPRVFFWTWSRTLKINLRALLYCNLALLSQMRLILRVHGFWFCSYGHVTVQIWMIIWVKSKNQEKYHHCTADNDPQSRF